MSMAAGTFVYCGYLPETPVPHQLKVSACVEVLRWQDLCTFLCCTQADRIRSLIICGNLRGQVLKKEMTLAGSSDITVAITEPQTGRKEVTLPVKVRQSQPAQFAPALSGLSVQSRTTSHVWLLTGHEGMNGSTACYNRRTPLHRKQAMCLVLYRSACELCSVSTASRLPGQSTLGLSSTTPQLGPAP